jgi:hypothetical protein
MHVCLRAMKQRTCVARRGLMLRRRRGMTVRTNKRDKNKIQVNSKALKGETCLWNTQRIIEQGDVHCAFTERLQPKDDILYWYSCSTTNKMYLLSQISYSCKTFYMFRTVFPSIIRSSKLRIQQRYVAAGCSICLTHTVAVYAVLSS